MFCCRLSFKMGPAKPFGTAKDGVIQLSLLLFKTVIDI